MDFRITISGSNASIFTPYDSKFVQKIKMIGGSKWNPAEKCWVVPANAVDTVRGYMREVYGMDDTAGADNVRVRLTFRDEYYEVREPVSFFSHVIARAFGRDSDARPGEDVIYISGGCASGGSMKNWHSIVNAGSVVELGSVPRALYENNAWKLPEYIESEIVPEAPVINRDELIAEKTRLEARIQEINKLLSEIGG